MKEDSYEGGAALGGRSWGCSPAEGLRGLAAPPAGTEAMQAAGWQHEAAPALLLAHPGGLHLGFVEGRGGWEEESARGSLSR